MCILVKVIITCCAKGEKISLQYLLIRLLERMKLLNRLTLATELVRARRDAMANLEKCMVSLVACTFRVPLFPVECRRIRKEQM